MEVRPNLHPSADDLRAFGLGTLDDAALAEVVGYHIESCPNCRKTVTELSGDDFINRLRQARGPSSTPAPAKSHAEPVASLRPNAGQTTIPGLPSELADHPDYEVLREVGSGGMGVAYQARNRLSGRMEVLKVMNKALIGHPESKKRFLREIQSVALLDHKNVVRMYNAQERGELMVLVMEYVPGENLEQVVTSDGRLPIPDACSYVKQIAAGLQHAFDKGLVHRDIKPQNLMRTRDGEEYLVKILDFGLAKARSENEEGNHGLTQLGTRMGTPLYMAPEQSLDPAGADIRADLYSLGCTLHFLLTGSPPFQANSYDGLLREHQSTEPTPLDRLRPDVSPELAAVATKLMAKDPARRYQTPDEVVEALSQHVAGLQGGQLSTGPAPAENQALNDERTIGRALLDGFSRLVRMRPERHKAAFQGTWKVMRAEGDGKVGPPESRTITFDGNGFIFRAEGQATQEGSFRLDANKDPMEIDLIVGKGEGGEGGGKLLGIYKFDRDTILLCFRLEEKGNRPVTFSAPPKSDQSFLMLKRNR